VWRDKELANDIISLFKSLCKVVDLEENIRYFEKTRNVKIKDFTQNYASEVGIKTEDALAVIVYSLIEVEYFVTFNKKHLRNKYAKLKEIGWKYGIKIPEIMLPSEFISLFSQLFEQSSGSLSSHHYSKFNRIVNFFGFPSHILLFSLFVFKSLFFSLFQLLKQISASSPSELSSDNYRINRAKDFLNFFFNLHSFNLESQFRYSFVKLPFISSASFIGSFFTFTTNAKFNSKKHKSFSFFNTSDFHNKFKFFFSILAFSLLLPLSLAQTQSHPLREITPIDVNLDMFGFNITNVSFVGINLTNPQYALHVAGDVYWTGSLRGGSVPWSLLTNYPSIITSIGSGLNASTQSLSGNVILGVNFTEVQKRVTGSCSGSNAIQVIYDNGSVSCVDINLYGNVTGRGTPYFIPMWQTSSSITDSLINQTNGDIWITSGNLNIVSGVLQIGGTNVIDSNRNILNVNWVNASYLNVSGGLVVLPSGNVGIGTTSPLQKLDVVGDVNATGAVYSVSGYYIGTNQIITAGRVLQNIASISQSLLPTTDNLYDLGSSSYRWRDAYFSGTIYGNVQGSITPTGNINMQGYSIYNAYDVNATRFFQGSNRVIDTVIAGNGLIGGGSGPFVILSLATSGVSPGTYGSASQVPQITVDSYGRITSASNVNIAIDASQIVSGIISSARLDSNVAWLNRSQTWTASQIFSENVWFNKNVYIAGNLSYVNVQTLNVNGSLIPIFSGQFDVGNSTYKWRNVTAVNIAGDNVYGNAVYSGGNAVLTTATNFSNAAGSDITVSGNYNSLNLQINAGAVGTNEIADNAVNMSKISQVSCPSGYALVSIGGGSYNCVQINATQGVINGSGSAGQVAFFTGPNTISGNDNLYWDNANARLGIGTKLPQQKLDVVGNVNVTNNLYALGNVGIGTTNPSEKLEVSGNIKLSGYINVAGSYIRKSGGSIVISDV
jgi:hypothetical protein